MTTYEYWVLVLRIVESWDGCGCSLGGELQFGRGEVGWERKKRRNRGRECRQIGGYIMVFSMESPTDYFRRWFHRRFRRWKCHVTVQLSQFESLENSVGKIVWRHHAVAYFQTNGMPHRRNGRYIPMEYFCRYIRTVSPTDLGQKLLKYFKITQIFNSLRNLRNLTKTYFFRKQY